jgi:hypothetical protein
MEEKPTSGYSVLSLVGRMHTTPACWISGGGDLRAAARDDLGVGGDEIPSNLPLPISLCLGNTSHRVSVLPQPSSETSNRNFLHKFLLKLEQFKGTPMGMTMSPSLFLTDPSTGDQLSGGTWWGCYPMLPHYGRAFAIDSTNKLPLRNRTTPPSKKMGVMRTSPSCSPMILDPKPAARPRIFPAKLVSSVASTSN